MMRAGMVTHAVERLYLTDPRFHRLVDEAVGTLEREHGIRFDAHDHSLATEAAGVALALCEWRECG